MSQTFTLTSNGSLFEEGMTPQGHQTLFHVCVNLTYFYVL